MQQNNNYLMQFQGYPQHSQCKNPRILKLQFGAAFLAGLAVGFWKDIEEIKSSYSEGQSFQPQMDSKRHQLLHQGW